jgi:TIR domain
MSLEYDLGALDCAERGRIDLVSPQPHEPTYESFQDLAEALISAGDRRLIFGVAAMRSQQRESYGRVMRVQSPGGLTPEGKATLSVLRRQAQALEALKHPMLHGVFISYRRQDTLDIAGRIFDNLCATLGEEACFKDVNSIGLGLDFRQQLTDALEKCSTMLVVIGRTWAQSVDEHGRNRLENPQDFVRLEIASALARNITVVPLLVSGATLPLPSGLPEEVRPLIYRQAFEVRSDPHFRSDMKLLVQGALIGVPQ